MFEISSQTKKVKNTILGISFVLTLLLCGCANTSSQQIGRDIVRARFEELSQAGTPEKIVDEYSRDVLVKEAPVFFPYHASYKGLHVYSDMPFKESDAVPILTEVHLRLSDSPIYKPERERSAFICHTEWKEKYYLGGLGKIGGRAYLHAAPHVFFTKADIKEDALMSPRGRPIAAPRTLTYYLAHEFTHVVLGEHLGMARFEALPDWVFEGYPDFVGLGPGYTAAKATDAYENRDPRVNGTMAEDYMRYGLMVATFLEKSDVKTLLTAPPAKSSFDGLFQK